MIIFFAGIMNNKIDELIVKAGIIDFSTTIDYGLIKDFEVPEEYLENIIPTLKILQSIRNKIGRVININSGYRSREYNISVGGKPNSTHLVFNAVDWTPVGYTRKDIERLYYDIDAGEYIVYHKGEKITPNELGLGLYDTFIHLDTRGFIGRTAPKRWRV